MFDPSCPRQLEIPPVEANSNVSVDATEVASLGASACTMLWMEWPLRRGIRTRQICVCRTGRATHDNLSCTSRRNVLGAIAMKRTIATSRSDDSPTNPIKINRQTTYRMNRFKKGRQRSPLPLRADPDANSFRLTNSYRNGDIDRSRELRNISGPIARFSNSVVLSGVPGLPRR